ENASAMIKPGGAWLFRCSRTVIGRSPGTDQRRIRFEPPLARTLPSAENAIEPAAASRSLVATGFRVAASQRRRRFGSFLLTMSELVARRLPSGEKTTLWM